MEPSIINFQDHATERYHEMLGDNPARRGGVMGLLKDMPIGEDIEVFDKGTWIKGTRHPKPTNYLFEVGCVSFAHELEVWEVLEKALSGFYNKPNSPIPWLKITPPSRRPGGPTK